jgi:hypothetical protein
MEVAETSVQKKFKKGINLVLIKPAEVNLTSAIP